MHMPDHRHARCTARHSRCRPWGTSASSCSRDYSLCRHGSSYIKPERKVVVFGDCLSMFHGGIEHQANVVLELVMNGWEQWLLRGTRHIKFKLNCDLKSSGRA